MSMGPIFPVGNDNGGNWDNYLNKIVILCHST